MIQADKLDSYNKSQNMNLLDFNSRFPNEESCRIYLKEKREAEAVTCKKCGCQKHYWLSTKNFGNVLNVIHGLI